VPSADGSCFVLKLGIWQVFDPWIRPELQALQGITVPTTSRPLFIEFHFRRVVYRLVRSLARLYLQVREWDEFLEAGGLTSAHPERVFEIPEEGGIAADSVFHYLNLFIDDLARMIPIVLVFDPDNASAPEGFNHLKTMLKKGQIEAPVRLRDLFAELDNPDSWWTSGFKWGVGMRQRLTHYTDMVYFAVSAKSGAEKMTGDVSLIGIGGGFKVSGFEEALAELLRKLCEWLEQLEHLLLPHLSQKLMEKGVHWDPLAGGCPTVKLPTPVSPELFKGSHMLYLPVLRSASA
jgi:hypothetical protein